MFYFIAIWFQAIKGVSALRSGLDSLPLVLAHVVTVAVTGGLTTKVGYYNPFIIASSIFMSIGSGLLTLFTVETSQSKWIAFQFLYGMGVGFGFQQGGIAAQAVLPFEDISVGMAIVLFVQVLGGAMFVSAAQNIFTNHLLQGLLALGIPDIDPQAIVNAGATALRTLVGPDRLPEVLVLYNEAIVKTFQIALVLSCLSIIVALGMEWKSVKDKNLDGVVA
jgi:hypothetical protein